MAPLGEKSCTPIPEGAEPLAGENLKNLCAQLAGWELNQAHHLTKRFRFPNFVQALAFVNRIGDLAEQQNHHPLIHLTWGKVTVELWTHAVKGLSQNDFILAAKIDTLPTD